MNGSARTQTMIKVPTIIKRYVNQVNGPYIKPTSFSRTIADVKAIIKTMQQTSHTSALPNRLHKRRATSFFFADDILFA
jgi:hypothetical protein